MPHRDHHSHHRHNDKKHDKKHSKKHDKKHSKKHDKKHDKKHKKHSKSESALEKAKRIVEAEKRRRGAPEITEEEFNARQPEFRVWLYNTKNKCVSDVEKKLVKEYFTKFVKKWNAGDLPELFYKGIPQAVIDQVPRVRHSCSCACRLCSTCSPNTGNKRKNKIGIDNDVHTN